MLAKEVVGSSQILFGTDDPFIGADDAHVTRLNISEADKRAILGGNAQKMFGLG